MKISSGVEAVDDGKNKKGKEREGKEKERKRYHKTHKSVIFHTHVAKAPMMQSSQNFAQLLILLAL